MRESLGKASAREFLYKECLPTWLSPEELRQGKYLLLLGEEPRELDFLDTFDVPRSQVYSVERQPDVYASQLKQNLGVHLWGGELINHLSNLLQGNDNFLFFGLDVEGSYFSQLDAAMTPVLLFSWRNSKTVVATYSSVGRDTEMLWEGIRSLAIFLWLDRENTLKVFSSLIERYRSVKFDSPVFMVLRDFFWLRSVLEHSLVASCMVGVTAPEIVKRWFDKTDILWREISIWQRQPLRLGNILSALDLFFESKDKRSLKVFEPPSCLGSAIDSFKHVVYNAERPWSQLCYFTTFKVLDRLIPMREWLAQSLQKIISEPLVYIDREGQRSHLVSRARRWKINETILWRQKDIYEKFKPRRLPITNISNNLATVIRTSLAAKKARSFLNGGKENKRMRYVDNHGKLTDFGKEKIHQYARELPNSSAGEILQFLPKSVQNLPLRTIVAHIAVGRRGLSKE